MATATRNASQAPALVIEEDQAALAVAYALPPMQFDLLAASGPPNGRHAYVQARILLHLRESPHPTADTWWAASGPNVAAALEHKTGLPESAATFIVAAASHALVMARSDRAEDHVLRLSERAACWYAGFLHGATSGQ